MRTSLILRWTYYASVGLSREQQTASAFEGNYDSLPSIGEDTTLRASNAEIIAILRMLRVSDGTPTVNSGHRLNPQKIASKR